MSTPHLQTFQNAQTVAEVLVGRITETYSREDARKAGIYYWPEPLPTPSQPLDPDPLILFRPGGEHEQLAGSRPGRVSLVRGSIAEFLAKHERERLKPTMQLPLGLVDKPEQQKQEALIVDLHGSAGALSGGPLLIAGAQHSGKSTALQSILLWLTTYYGPNQLRCAIIDPHHELDVFRELPHLLDGEGHQLWTDGSSDEKLEEFARNMHGLLAKRREAFPEQRWTENSLGQLWTQGHIIPQVLLIICHYHSFAERFNAAITLKKLALAMAEARTMGMYLVVSSAEVGYRFLSSELMGKFGTSIGLYLNELQRLDLFGRPPILPDPIPGRGLILAPDRSIHQVQLALPIAGPSESVRYEILKHEIAKLATRYNA
ncbi:hypothetical protein KSD_29930 [Ktedonobacter sp. SOSP1-85]|uniref:FtsK/SpoIIIE domain-containing protein n=1 Tax=Ktedonobacter sp. SOSP1-85 TaxID=2778367 RepID=UPI0019163B75|nr:FtsK/SpoIIIE domain-containing protein [Ktedonobacter sp. SOSP1-85]GHO75222.1 hypothetical protein KSD_29930 [Ktedonobacter sp. SOSP1-85]